MLSHRLLISHPMTMISAAGGAGKGGCWGTTGVFVCVRLASECVCLTWVCAVSCVSRQTPRPERQHTHFEVVEGCAHPLEARIYLLAMKSWKCPGMLFWGVVLENHKCSLPLRMRKRNVMNYERISDDNIEIYNITDVNCSAKWKHSCVHKLSSKIAWWLVTWWWKKYRLFTDGENKKYNSHALEAKKSRLDCTHFKGTLCCYHYWMCNCA